jgi:hypothetical protein
LSYYTQQSREALLGSALKNWSGCCYFWLGPKQ